MKRQIKKVNTQLERILDYIEEVLADADTDYEIYDFLNDVIKPEVQEILGEIKDCGLD